MADAELLLTINGADVTADVWEWRTVTLSDSWRQHPQLGFTLRQAWGSVTTVAPYGDVRLLNLLTGQVLFEGIIAPGPVEQRDVDPTWVETDVQAVGYQALLDTALAGTQARVPETSLGFGLTTQVVDALLAGAFTDPRVWLRPSTAYSGSLPTYPYVMNDRPNQLTVERTALATALQSVMDDAQATNATGSAGSSAKAFVAKLLPGVGMVITPPDQAPLGAAALDLTTAGEFGRPAAVAVAQDGTGVASAEWYTTDGVTWSVLEPAALLATYGIADPCNGYVVWAPDLDGTTGTATTATYWWRGDGSVRTIYRVTTPLVPYDYQVGQSVTFSTARLGTVTGVVQSISTRFTDGVYDSVSRSWPYFLDGSRTFDGTWNLSATAQTATIARRMRQTTMEVAATTVIGSTRRFASYLRTGTY